MQATRRAYLQLHAAVLLWGLTAILGDLIQLSALVMVWWRVFITCLSLLFFIQFGRSLLVLPRKLILQFIGIGFLVGLHWICFFGAVKFSNASICLVCMATTSFFTSLVEPLLRRQPVKWYEIGLGLLIVPGMLLVVNNIEGGMMIGVWVALLSALLAAIFATLNKILIEEAGPMQITFLELGGACLLISAIFPFYFAAEPEALFWPSSTDWLYLGVLTLLCTTLAYYLSLIALRYLSAFASTLVVNLEPIYGIILAFFLLNDFDELSPGFYLGGALIAGVVLSYPWMKRRFDPTDLADSPEID